MSKYNDIQSQLWSDFMESMIYLELLHQQLIAEALQSPATDGEG